MVVYARNISDKINRLLTIFPAVVLVGARQTGKTHLVRQLRPNWRYLDLEKPSDYQTFSQNAELYLEQFNKDLILDEAQNYPQLFNILRGVIDNDRMRKGRFLITGSSSPGLLNNISESLAGRVGIIEVGTLKANEFYDEPLSNFYQLFKQKLMAKDLEKLTPLLTRKQMQTLWLKGGYPEAVQLNDSDYSMWMENYINTYVNRDIAQLFSRLNKQKYQAFILMLAKLSSTIVNKADLGRALEINESTAREYLKIADMTFIWRELLSYESHAMKATVKMPKGHFRDSGLLHTINRIYDMEDLLTNPLLGRSFESFVIEELLKGLQALPISNWRACYYRTRVGAEVDLILEGPFGILPVEIKHGLTVKINALTSLQNFIKSHDLNLGLVINQSDTAMWLTDRIFQLPVNYI